MIVTEREREAETQAEGEAGQSRTQHFPISNDVTEKQDKAVWFSGPGWLRWLSIRLLTSPLVLISGHELQPCAELWTRHGAYLNKPNPQGCGSGIS